MRKNVILTGQMRSGTTLLSCFLDAQDGATFYADLLHIQSIKECVDGIGLDKELSWYQKIKVIERFFGSQRGLEVLRKATGYTLDLKILPEDFNTLTGFYELVLDALNPDNVDIVGHKTTVSEEVIEELLMSSSDTYCIHIFRDPRDVVTSSKRKWGFKSVFSVLQSWSDGWKAMSSAIGNAEIRDRILQVSYESLMMNTDKELERIREFLDLKEIKMDVKMYCYGKPYMDNSSYTDINNLFDTKAIGRWKSSKHHYGYLANKVVGQKVLSEALFEEYGSGIIRGVWFKFWFKFEFFVNRYTLVATYKALTGGKQTVET